jgi:hypothetical protein
VGSSRIRELFEAYEFLFSAITLIELYSARSASAVVIQDSIGTPFPFITADERLFTVARDCNLETIAVTH